MTDIAKVPAHVEVFPEPGDCVPPHGVLDVGLRISIRPEDLVALALSPGRMLQLSIDGRLVQIRSAREYDVAGEPSEVWAHMETAHGDNKRVRIVEAKTSSPDFAAEYGPDGHASRALFLLDSLPKVTT